MRSGIAALEICTLLRFPLADWLLLVANLANSWQSFETLAARTSRTGQL